MKKKTLLLNAALLGMMAVSGKVMAKDNADKTTAAPVLGKCQGVNGCKGTSDCGGAKNTCHTHNACKGQGWLKLTKEECTKKDENAAWEEIKV